ncbi:MAG: DUF971 domain-containing protein [Gammaproteobacteria bacterium]|nr:DUF971 domain-containing protein [Gammaproteobacteria bacterium]
MVADAIKVHWEDGTVSSYSWFWLRDHAKDPISFDSRSQQRELFTAMVDPDITPIHVEKSRDGDSVLVSWPDLHEPVLYSADFFFEFMQPENRLNSWKKTVWDAQSISEDDYSMDWSQFLQDDGLQQLMTRVTSNGFALVKSCPTNFDTIAHISGQIGYVRHTIFGGMWEFEANEGMSDSAYTPKELRPHTDGTYSHDAPGLQLLMCCHYDAEGGDSIMVDGLKIAQCLEEDSPESFELLKSIPIKGRYSGDGVELIAQRPVFKTDDNGEILQVSFNNYDRAPFRLEDGLMKKFYHALRAYEVLANSPNLQWRHVLAPGEMLVFDNWRVMHGRGAFTGKRKMAGCYLNREDTESCARKLGLMY